MKPLIAVLLGASPIVLHLAIVWSSSALMGVFLAIVTAGVLLSLSRRRFPVWGVAAAALGAGGLALVDLGTAAWIAGSWPILVYVAIAWAFGSTLRPGRMPLVERFARLIDHGDAMPAALVAYTRRLTWVWTVFPLALAATSLLLAHFASREVWSLFTNVLSYFALAALFLAEYPYRRWRYPDTPHTNPFTVAVRLARHAPGLFGRQGRLSG